MGAKVVRSTRFCTLKKRLPSVSAAAAGIHRAQMDADTVVGHEAARRGCGEDAALLSAARRQSPMGYLLRPVGTGKSFAQCVSRDRRAVRDAEELPIDVNGETRAISNACCSVLPRWAGRGRRREAGTRRWAAAKRNDSGTSSRAFAMTAAQMGDTVSGQDSLSADPRPDLPSIDGSVRDAEVHIRCSINRRSNPQMFVILALAHASRLTRAGHSSVATCRHRRHGRPGRRTSLLAGGSRDARGAGGGGAAQFCRRRRARARVARPRRFSRD
jgi:hypothetical protein